MSTSHSYKIFSLPELKVIFHGPHFENKVRYIAVQNEFTFIGVKQKIFKLHYYSIVSEFNY